VESILWQIASTLTTHVGSVRVAPPGVSGSQPFPQVTEEGREDNAGNPIGSKKALVQTDVTAQVTAALTAATQRISKTTRQAWQSWRPSSQTSYETTQCGGPTRPRTKLQATPSETRRRSHESEGYDNERGGGKRK
jgi:hypothetical protein